MRKMLLTLAASAIALAGGIAGAQAQQGSSGSMMGQDQPGTMMQQHGGSAQPGQSDNRRPGMMDSEMRGRPGEGPGRMGPGMMVMMMVMMDTDGDGALSLEEVQAVHTRMFNYADADDDGKLTLEELQSFFHGGGFHPDDR